MLSVKGLVLNPPKIIYGEGRWLELSQKAGAWNVLNQKFYKPARPLERWAVACFHQATYSWIDAFVKMLMRNLQALGMAISRSPYIEADCNGVWDRSYGSVATRQCPQAQTSALNSYLCYSQKTHWSVKNWGDTVGKVPTQCVHSGKLDRANE